MHTKLLRQARVRVWILAVLCATLGGPFASHAQRSKKRKMAEQAPIEAKTAPVRLMIDPGHGGLDPGNERSQPKYKHEKDIALDVALMVGALLKESNNNLEIIYTRKSDVFRKLEDRVILAEEKKADYFVSIHCNSNPSPHIKGVQLHIHDHGLMKSRKMAQAIERELKHTAKRKSKGIFNAKDRRHNLYVLQYSSMPGVLVETGFMSNPDEEQFLNSEKGQWKLAEAIARGITTFLVGLGHEFSVKATPAMLAHAPVTEAKPQALYKVQISASDKPIPPGHRDFRKLDMDVEEHETNDKQATFRYIYTVGAALTFEAAQELLKKVQEAGFKDAFIKRFSSQS